MYFLSKLLQPTINTGNKYFISRYKTKTMKYLNVAEKRDAAKNIAKYLSKNSYRMVQGNYEFEAEVFGQISKMVMTSVSGHLLNYEFIEKSLKDWKKFKPKVLFDEKIIKNCIKNNENIKNTLKKQIRYCDALIIWTDCDREGENIGFEILDVCKAEKHSIRIYRAKFSEITSQSVSRALCNLENPNENISKAVDIRQELDLRIGAAFTRLQTMKLQTTFPSHFHEVISYGSCQFPTLGFVVERYRAITDFVTEPFWKLKVTHEYKNALIVFLWDRVRIFDEEICKILHNVCIEGGVAKVEDVKTKPKTKWRPLPLDTVELEKQASRKLNINAKETMRIAEKLYIAGIISYPRTETNKFSKDINLTKLIELQKEAPNWGQFAQNILTYGPNPRQGNKSDEAHPPIHPIKYAADLTGNDKRLYEFVVRSFLACCSKDARGQETVVTVTLGDEIFRASGLVVQEKNYLEVYPYDKWATKEIPAYEIGQTFIPKTIEIEEGKTSPPQLLTEADLIALMEKHGIGTDATHADHIETIKNRKYVVFQENTMTDDNTLMPGNTKAKTFIPTQLGMGLVTAYEAMGLSIAKPNLRAQFEADLKLICEGKKVPDIVLKEQIDKYKNIYNVIESNISKLTDTIDKYYVKNSQTPHQPQNTESTTAGNAINRRRPSNSASVSVNNARRENTTNLTSNSERVLCLCNQPARQFTSQKRNENYGKKFFKCYKDNGCNFFKWAENAPTVRNPNLPSTSRMPSANDSTAAQNNTSASRRRCSVCRQVGHNIKNCPTKFPN